MSKQKANHKKILEISSPSNVKIKNIARMIRDGSARQNAGVIVVDGAREVEEAVNAKWEVQDFFYCLDFVRDDFHKKSLINKLKLLSRNSFQVSAKVFEKISYKKNPDGCLATLSYRETKLEDIKIKKDPLVLVLESVEKPGNLGAIIRTAYASGVDLIILNDQKTDLYSPNVIRASTGFIFAMPLVLLSIKSTIEYLNEKKINIFATSILASKNHFSVDFKKGVAIIFGSEAFGLSDNWAKDEIEKIRIPMIDGVDSLNVSVSVGIVVYEALRQRKRLK